jgi:hypothetical protein
MDNIDVIDVIRPIVDEGSVLTVAELYLDDDLSRQCVGIHLAFSETEIFVHAEGNDDSIRVLRTPPATLLDGSICKVPAPTEWAPAIGKPVLWAWAMINTQGRNDGIQIEFGTVDRPSITVQMLVRASTLVVRIV